MSNCYTDDPRTTCERDTTIWQWDGGKQILTIVLFERRNKGCKERGVKGYRSGAVGRLFPQTYMRVCMDEFIETTAPLPHMLQIIKETLQGAMFFV